jgi:hypothetical protein
MSRFSGASGPLHPFTSHGIKRKRELSHLPEDSINPLSHPPAVLKQYRVAGLSSSEHIPSETLPDFPHRQWRDVPSAAGWDVSPASEPTGRTLPLAGKHPRPAQRYSTSKDQLIEPLVECIRICIARGDYRRARKAMTALVSMGDKASQAQVTALGPRRKNLEAEFVLRETLEAADQPEHSQTARLGAGGFDRRVPKPGEHIAALISEHPEGPGQLAPAQMPVALLSAGVYLAYRDTATTQHGIGRDTGMTRGEVDSSPGGGSVSSDHSNALSTDGKGLQGFAGELGQHRRASFKIMESILRQMEMLMKSPYHRNNIEFLRLYSTALFYTADLHSLRDSDLLLNRTETSPRVDELRDTGTDTLQRIVHLGGQIDDRLRNYL